MVGVVGRGKIGQRAVGYQAQRRSFAGGRGDRETHRPQMGIDKPQALQQIFTTGAWLPRALTPAE